MKFIDGFNQLMEMPVDTNTLIVSFLIYFPIAIFGQISVEQYDEPDFKLSNTVPAIVFLLAGILAFFSLFKITQEVIFGLLAYLLVTYISAYLYFRFFYSRQN